MLSHTFFAVVTWVLVLTCAPGVYASSAPQHPVHLSLWVTNTFGLTDGHQCVQPVGSALPSTSPTLTDEDVFLGDEGLAYWVLDTDAFEAPESEFALTDRCFVLALDGRLIASGVVLASRSERLTALPTLIVDEMGKAVRLRLTVGNGNMPAELLHVKLLHRVFAQRAHLQAQLQRFSMVSKAEPLADQQYSMQWNSAVMYLMDSGRIRRGMPFADLYALLGQPSMIGVLEIDQSTRHHWYFNTPKHINPLFEARVQNGLVLHFALSTR